MLNQTSSLADCADDELVTRAQQNDEAAFSELTHRTSRSSFLLAMSILRDRQDAEDEMQNSYRNAWRHLNQFQRESKFSTWIARIVTNQCLMRLRSLGRAVFVYLDDVGIDGGMRPTEVTDLGEAAEANFAGQELSSLLQQEIRDCLRSCGTF